MGEKALHLILISGAGRNVGKTTLGCAIIEILSKKVEVTSIKISKHLHPLTEKQRVILQKSGLIITEELDRGSSKDSSRFLRSGATHSFFVMADDDHFTELAVWVKQNLTGSVICETGHLGNFIIPNVAFYIENEYKEKQVKCNFPYFNVRFNGEVFTPSIEETITKIFSQ
jgi:hypothetical protein